MSTNSPSPILRTRSACNALRALALAALAWAGAVVSCTAASEALTSIVVDDLTAALPSGGGGFAFRPASDVSIMSLGCHLDSSISLTNQMVEVLDVNGVVLTTTNVTLNEPVSGLFHYQVIQPLFLAAGSTNYIVSYDRATYLSTGKKVWAGSVIVRDTLATAWFNVDTGLEYLGAAQGADVFAGSTNTLFLGPNFTFGAPVQPPILHIALAPTNLARLYWRTQYVGYVLQATTNLVAAPGTNVMTNVVAPVTIDGDYFVVLADRIAPRTFYRLWRTN